MSKITTTRKVLNTEFERQLKGALRAYPFAILTLLMQGDKRSKRVFQLKKDIGLEWVGHVSVAETIDVAIDKTVATKIALRFKTCFSNFVRDVNEAERDGEALLNAGKSFSGCLSRRL